MFAIEAGDGHLMGRPWGTTGAGWVQTYETRAAAQAMADTLPPEANAVVVDWPDDDELLTAEQARSLVIAV